jgi:hypothetical protein
MKPEPISPYPNVFMSAPNYSFPPEGWSKRGVSADLAPRSRQEDRLDAPDGELAA